MECEIHMCHMCEQMIYLVFLFLSCFHSPETSTNASAMRPMDCCVARWWLLCQESLLHCTCHSLPVAVAFCTVDVDDCDCDDGLLALAAVSDDFQCYSFLSIVALVHCQPLNDRNEEDTKNVFTQNGF